MGDEERAAIAARRALLREQTLLIAPRLPWLADPARIPASAVDASVPADDVRLAAFSLAGWMLVEFLQAAHAVDDELHWEEAMAPVVPRLQASVARSVLCPATKHAPGLFAVAEIMAVLPALACRGAVPRAGWRQLARHAEAFGALLARDGTAVQVLVRHYLQGPHQEDGLPGLDAALLRLDAASGIASVTPLPQLLAAARAAAALHYEAPPAICLALQARVAPATTMFGAVWAAFAHAADRFVFPRFDPGAPLPAQAAPDPACAPAMERIAAGRRQALAQAAVRPCPPAVERILANLLAARAGPPGPAAAR